MANKHTTHYQLCQWQAEDAVIRADFNDDNTKVDAALRGLETGKATVAALTAVEAAVNQKANQSALTSLQATVNQKANQTEVNALTTRVGALESKHNTDVTLLRGENPWAALLDVTVTAASDSVTIPLAGISLTDYRELHISINYPQTKEAFTYFQLGNVTSGYYSISLGDSGSTSSTTQFSAGYTRGIGVKKIVLMPMSTTGVGFFLQSVGFSSLFGVGEIYGGSNNTIAYRNITSLRFFQAEGTQVPAGARFTLYGLKEKI